MIEPMRNKIVSHEEYEMRSTVYDNFTGFILYSFLFYYLVLFIVALHNLIFDLIVIYDFYTL